MEKQELTSISKIEDLNSSQRERITKLCSSNNNEDHLLGKELLLIYFRNELNVLPYGIAGWDYDHKIIYATDISKYLGIDIGGALAFVYSKKELNEPNS